MRFKNPNFTDTKCRSLIGLIISLSIVILLDGFSVSAQDNSTITTSKGDEGSTTGNPVTSKPRLPSSTEPEKIPPEYKNCINIPLKSPRPQNVQLQWETEGNDVKFKVSAYVKKEEYIAIGFGKDLGKTMMKDADVILNYFDKREPKSVDFFLNAYSQCDVNGVGACPDTSQGGTNNVKLISGSRVNGYNVFRFRRPIKATDPNYDHSLETERTVFAALGALAENMNPLKHVDGRIPDQSSDVRIKADSSGIDKCMYGDAFTKKNFTEEKPPEAWKVYEMRNVKEFKATIGGTGGPRGFPAITGRHGWGYSWWINGILIPRIYVKRGETYTFNVYGGSTHPLYITNMAGGGLEQEPMKDIVEKTYVYAGVVEGKPVRGPQCLWEKKPDTPNDETFDSIEKFVQAYKEDCSTKALSPPLPNKFTWTVGNNVPDTVFYECYTHVGLGFNISVEGTGGPDNPNLRDVLLNATRQEKDKSKPKDNGTSANIYPGLYLSFPIILILAAAAVSKLTWN